MANQILRFVSYNEVKARDQFMTSQILKLTKSLIKTFLYMIKKSRQKFKYLTNEKNF